MWTGGDVYLRVHVCSLLCKRSRFIRIDKSPTRVTFPSKLRVIAVEEATWPAKLQR